MKIRVGKAYIEINRLSKNHISIRCPDCGQRFHIDRDQYEGREMTECPQEECEYAQNISYADIVQLKIEEQKKKALRKRSN